jgi:hypothetical protein
MVAIVPLPLPAACVGLDAAARLMTADWRLREALTERPFRRAFCPRQCPLTD